MAAGLGVARSRRNMAKNPQPQLPRSTGTGIRDIPGTSAEAVKIPPFSLPLSPFASPAENYLCTRAYKKKYTRNATHTRVRVCARTYNIAR